MNSTSLIVLAHGSRSELANQEVAVLAQRLSGLGVADQVEHAFLEIAQPEFHACVDANVARGSGTIIVLPLFLSSGRHVLDHVPKLVEVAEARHPEIQFRLLSHIGASEQFIASIERFVRAGVDTAGDA